MGVGFIHGSAVVTIGLGGHSGLLNLASDISFNLVLTCVAAALRGGRWEVDEWERKKKDFGA